MISTFNKNELMHGPHNHHMPSALSSNNQRVTATVNIIKNTTSMSNANATGNNTKRKNFKNMFYSPKNHNREAYTEPHSKMIS